MLKSATTTPIPGIGSMPPTIKPKNKHMYKNDNSDMTRFFAQQGVPPLSHAFQSKIAVHPGLGGTLIAKEQVQKHMDCLLDKERKGKSVAYIHVPFCQTHCLYCGFYNKAYHKNDSKIYTDTLIKELELWSKKKAVTSSPIHAVYLGGGTPTALDGPDLTKILKKISEILPLANDCEITIEGRLSNFDASKMEACLKGGANRFSLGVQSFQTEIRRSMGRLGTQEDMIHSLELLMSYGQASVIVDLIFGFPRQTMDLWLEDIAIAQSLNLDGADCYQLNIYKNTPLGKAIEEGKMPAGADLPKQSAMFAAGVEAMEKAFYRRLSISHWARTSRERNLYNLYVKGSANCLAFGPGAGGNLTGNFYMNNSDYKIWQKAVLEGVKPYAMAIQPRQDWLLFRDIAENLEQGWLDMLALKAKHKVDIEFICFPLIEQWQHVGLLENKAGKLVLTIAGQFWQVNLSQLLQEYLKMNMEKN